MSPRSSRLSEAPTSRDDPRAHVTVIVHGVKVPAFVWHNGRGWWAAVPAGRREVMIVDAVDREDALARACDSIMSDADIARALGVSPERRWSANLYWKGQ